MNFLYSVFGLRLKSNRPIMGLPACSGLSRIDVTVALDGIPSSLLASAEPHRLWYVSDSSRRGRPLLTIWKLRGDGYYRLLYSDGAQFVVRSSGRRVWAQIPATLNSDDLAYLLGPVLSFVLLLRGTTCLHASAVAVRGRAILFVGMSGCGKSTAAAMLAGCGAAVLTDDLAALWYRAGTFYVQPGFPWLRLRPPSLELLNHGAPRPAVRPTSDACYLDLIVPQLGYEAANRPAPIEAIYLMDGLETGGEGDSIGKVEGLSFLLANTWTTRVLDREMRAHEFGVLARLARGVPLRRLHPAQLPRLSDVVLDKPEAIKSLTVMPPRPHVGYGCKVD